MTRKRTDVTKAEIKALPSSAEAELAVTAIIGDLRAELLAFSPTIFNIIFWIDVNKTLTHDPRADAAAFEAYGFTWSPCLADLATYDFEVYGVAAAHMLEDLDDGMDVTLMEIADKHIRTAGPLLLRHLDWSVKNQTGLLSVDLREAA